MRIRHPHRKRGYRRPRPKRIPCLCFSRVVGYISPLQLWNDGKRQEFADRRVYEVPGMEVMR